MVVTTTTITATTSSFHQTLPLVSHKQKNEKQIVILHHMIITAVLFLLFGVGVSVYVCVFFRFHDAGVLSYENVSNRWPLHEPARLVVAYGNAVSLR